MVIPALRRKRGYIILHDSTGICSEADFPVQCHCTELQFSAACPFGNNLGELQGRKAHGQVRLAGGPTTLGDVGHIEYHVRIRRHPVKPGPFRTGEETRRETLWAVRLSAPTFRRAIISSSRRAPARPRSPAAASVGGRRCANSTRRCSNSRKRSQIPAGTTKAETASSRSGQVATSGTRPKSKPLSDGTRGYKALYRCKA